MHSHPALPFGTTENMNRNVLTGLVVVSALGAILFLSRTSGFQRTAIPPRTTFLITLGERATSAESWDGRAEVSLGSIAGLEGWHFLTGQTASGSSWRASVRVDEVAPFSDPHYTELRGGEKPAPCAFLSVFTSPWKRRPRRSKNGARMLLVRLRSESHPGPIRRRIE